MWRGQKTGSSSSTFLSKDLQPSPCCSATASTVFARFSFTIGWTEAIERPRLWLHKVVESFQHLTAMMNFREWQEENLLSHGVALLKERGVSRGPGQFCGFAPHPTFIGKADWAKVLPFDAVVWNSICAQSLGYASSPEPQRVRDGEGQSLTLPQLAELAGRVTAYYQDHGFPLTRAIIPAQSITGGVVIIQVVEARYGKVQLNNHSEVSDVLLNATLAPLNGGKLISDAELNRALLLLSDVQGVGVSAVLKPGTEVATADMEVEARYNKAPLVNVSLDNYGSRDIGRARLSGNINIVNPFHHGDILSANIISTGERMNYSRVAYDTLFNGQGTRVGGAYSILNYKLGSAASALDAHGDATVASLWAKHPLVRSKQYSVYGQLQYDGKNLRDRIDVSGLRADRHLNNWVLSVNGDLRDDLLAGGMSMASLGLTSGRKKF